MPSSSYQPIYEFTRGQTVESVHFGAVAVVDATGRLTAWYGNPQAVSFIRSSAKPFQALPFLEAGGLDHFGLSQKEIAVLCASHSGTDEHVEVVTALQAKAQLTPDHLQCGVHPISHKPTRNAMQARNEEPTPIRHTCSGKHSGMLAYAQMRDWDLDTYLDPSHPVQDAILQTFAAMTGVDPDEVALGTDGCSAPNFAVPLANAALAYAHLADPATLHPERAAALTTIRTAMTAEPYLVAGPDRFDTLLIQAGGGMIVAKGGAEGYQGIGLLPNALGEGSPALGVVVKISDGDRRNSVVSAVALEILHQLGALSDEQLQTLKSFGPRQSVKNWRKLEVGEGRPIFTLERE